MVIILFHFQYDDIPILPREDGDVEQTCKRFGIGSRTSGE